MSRRRPSLEREVALWDLGRTVVAGLDEAGRGPLAGPVVAAAVVFPPGCPRIRGLDDSKRCTARQRERLAGLVRERALAVAVGAASVREIDRFNIRRASVLAMRRALTRLAVPPAAILVDGLPCPELGLPHEAIINGDALCYSIAAASLIAKTVRDRLMTRLAPRYPAYAWDQNMGYATALHRDVLAAQGPTPHHRRSFFPVLQMAFL
ncbi:MAG TPA: ribonuclease HII [Gemmatimonadales bacterium]